MFEFQTPRQMLEKAKREFQILKEQPNKDNVFNFFVSAHHVIDYLGSITSVPEKDLNALYNEPDFRKCKFISNKSKHHRLKKGDNEFITRRRPGANLGGFVLGKSALGLGPAYYIIDGVEDNVVDLGQRVINLLEIFINKHGI